MMNKQHAITMPKTWSHTGSFAFHLHELIAKLGHVFQIPTGYQDEKGFHYGAEPVKQEAKFPSVW